MNLSRFLFYGVFYRSSPKYKKGKTPLILAVENNNLEAIKVLLPIKNIKLNTKDFDKKIALDYAKEKGADNIVKLINLARVPSLISTPKNQNHKPFPKIKSSPKKDSKKLKKQKVSQ